MIGAAGVESRAAHRTHIVTAKVVDDAESDMAVATQDCFGLSLAQTPHNGRVASHCIVA